MTDTEVRIMLNGLKRISELKGCLPIDDRRIIREAYFWIKNRSEETQAPAMVCTFTQIGENNTQIVNDGQMTLNLGGKRDAID